LALSALLAWRTLMMRITPSRGVKITAQNRPLTKP
jgi:hypothetical protein